MSQLCQISTIKLIKLCSDCMKKIVLFCFVVLNIFLISDVRAVECEVIIDADSGRVLHGFNIDEKRYIASTTKIMTTTSGTTMISKRNMRLNVPPAALPLRLTATHFLRVPLNVPNAAQLLNLQLMRATKKTLTVKRANRVSKIFCRKAIASRSCAMRKPMINIIVQ